MSVEKILSFKEKIDIILKLKGLKVKDLERQWGKDSTLYKALDNPNGLSRRLLKEFLLKFSVKPAWWESPIGRGESDVFEEKPTQVEENSDMADPEEIYRNIVEGNTEYVLIPRSVIQEKYRLVALEQFIKDKEQMERDNATINKLLDKNEALVSRLLESKLPGVKKTK